MTTVFNILGPLAVAAVAVVLVMGLWNLAKGGTSSRSQQLMRMRVLLQAVAIVVLMFALWASGR